MGVNLAFRDVSPSIGIYCPKRISSFRRSGSPALGKIVFLASCYGVDHARSNTGMCSLALREFMADMIPPSLDSWPYRPRAVAQRVGILVRFLAFKAIGQLGHN